MKTHWIVGMVVAAGLQAQPQGCPVDVYVKTGVLTPVGMLLSANLRAAAIFSEIGVDIRIRLGEPPRNPKDTCGSPILIQIEATTPYTVRKEALAYAFPFRDSGASIHVFLDRVLLNRRQPFANALLAHVMVHEITHVLQGVDRHSETGMMKARWSGEDLNRMQFRPLAFASSDVELIHLGLLKRMTHAVRNER